MPTLIRWTLYLAEKIRLPVHFTHRLFMAYETRRKPAQRERRRVTFSLLAALPARRRKMRI